MKRKEKSTYENNDKIEYRPKTGEVSLKTQRHPLQNHFHDEHHAKHKIGPVQQTFQHQIRVQIDILETQCDARRKYQHQHKPFERRRVNHMQDSRSRLRPTLLTDHATASRPARTSAAN